MTSGQLHIQPHNTMEVANSNQELLSKGSKKKTTAIVLVIVMIAFIVAALVYFLKAEQIQIVTSSSYTATKQGLTLESVIAGEFNPRGFNGTWVSDSEILYKSREGDLLLYNARTNKSRVILGSDVEILKAAFHYELSADHRYLMLAHNYQKLYRYSFLASYHIVDLETRKSWEITDINGSEQTLLQLVQWAPVGNAFVYVYMNDIYYRTSAREQQIQEYRLTRTGRPGTIYNGVPDWVYEEEILESNKALWFSPDGTHLVFATFNDSRTPVMTIPYYGAPGDLRYQYTQGVNIRYPKPGRPNPIVSLSVLNLAELQFQKPVIPDIPPKQELKEPVLSLVTWAAPHQFIAIWMNRVQNEAAIVQCFTMNNNCQETLSLNERSGWVSLTKPLFSPDGTKMAIILSVDQGNDLGPYAHLTMVDLNSRGPVRPVPMTSGKFVVTELLAWDEKFIYFLSTEENEPSHLKIGKVPATVEGAPHNVECISCPWDKTDRGECLYTGAVFSQKFSYYMQTCAGPVVPEITLFSKNGDKIITWERNNRVSRKLENVILPINKGMRVPIISGTNTEMMAHVMLHLPPGIDTSGKTKYPLLVQVYGGPGSNMVTERFNIDWYSHLVVNQSVIYAKIDGRGSGLKGDNMLFSNYKKLGTYEIHDQINVTRYLINKLKYIDENRTAIWGWSYGGYATGMVMAQDTKGVFKCGISVAPVTDWLLYDTLYTERYMGLPSPEDNLRGYEEASLNNKVDNFRNKLFFLIHGTFDDNVHYQQSMMLAKALETNDILFEQQSYPDEAHGLSDVRPHLYHSIHHFLKQCFNKPH